MSVKDADEESTVSEKHDSRLSRSSNETRASLFKVVVGVSFIAATVLVIVPQFLWRKSSTTTKDALGAESPEATVEHPAGEVSQIPTPDNPTTIVFATVEQAKRILTARDDFIRRLSPFDRAARMKSDKDVSERDFLNFVGGNVLAWTDAEKQKVTSAFQGVRMKLGTLRSLLPEEVYLIKTTGNEEGDAPYTRARAIVLPASELARSEVEMQRSICHELFHIVSRLNPELREKLYAAIGFVKCDEIEFPQDLKARKITNPDAPRNDHFIRLQVDGKAHWAIPVLFSSNEKYDLNRSGEFFDYLQLRFLLVENDENSPAPKPIYDGPSAKLVSMEEVSGFIDQVGRNTAYLIHPEEILAENFVLLVFRQANVPSPDIIDKLDNVLTQYVEYRGPANSACLDTPDQEEVSGRVEQVVEKLRQSGFVADWSGDVLHPTFSIVYSTPEVGDEDLEHLAGLGKLEHLNLFGTKVTDAGLAHLTETNPTGLTLSETQVTDNGLKHLKGLSGLERLSLQRVNITDAGLLHLKGLTNLRFLELSGTQVTDTGLMHLEELTELKGLSLDETRVTGIGLKHCKELRSLELSNTQITDAALSHLKALTKLNNLGLSRTQVSDRGLQNLEGLTKLRELNLDDTQVTDVGLAYLKGLVDLERLSLQRDQITNSGLAHLKALTNLRSLVLSDTHISDAGLVHLKGMTKLSSLFLIGTQVTVEGVQDPEEAFGKRGKTVLILAN